MKRLAAVLTLVLGLVVGCGGGGSPTPVASPSASASAAPTTSSVASPASSPAAAESAGMAAGGPLVERTVAILNADPLILHVDQVATAKSTSAAQPVNVRATMALDLNGDDLSGHLGGTTQGTKIDTDLVIVGDTTYARSNGAPWQTSPRSLAANSIASLTAAVRVVSSASQLRDAGVEMIEGRSLHHLTAATTIPYTTTGGAKGSYDDFDLYVEDDGTPVLFRGSFTGTSGVITVTGTSELRYSKVGGPITIKAPAISPSPSPKASSKP